MSMKDIQHSTSTYTIKESHLLLPMIWEGDLNIHSNVEMMRNSKFNDIILHGDTGLSIAISLIEKDLGKPIFFNTITSRYKSIIRLHDKVFVSYQINNNQIPFSLLNQNNIEILQGKIQDIEGCL